MKKFLLIAVLGLLFTPGAYSQVINAPISEACAGNFDSSYRLQVLPGESYNSQVLGSYTTEYSSGGSGKGGGYKPGHATIRYSKISAVTVRDANSQVIATFAAVPTNVNGHPLDKFEGSFVSRTKSVTVQVTGLCLASDRMRGTPPDLRPGPAAFALSITGAPLPTLPARRHDDD